MRIRTIKPEFFNHEGIYEAEKEFKLPLRVAFIGLWCAADREGRFRVEPRRLGIQILPYDNVDFSRVLHALSTRGFVVIYRVDDVCFGCIPGFQKHQIVNNRESFSSIPSHESENASFPNSSEELNAWVTRGSRAKDALGTPAKGKGREGKGERRNDACKESFGGCNGCSVRRRSNADNEDGIRSSRGCLVFNQRSVPEPFARDDPRESCGIPQGSPGLVADNQRTRQALGQCWTNRNPTRLDARRHEERKGSLHRRG